MRLRRDELSGDRPDNRHSHRNGHVAALACTQGHARAAHGENRGGAAMSCELWADKLDAYVDNEGSHDDFSAMEDHLRACPDCARDALGRIQLKRATQAAAL